MADPVVIVEEIIGIAIRIAYAVETVRQNREECRGIEKLVRRVSDLLSLLKESQMMRHRVVGGPLENLEDAIRRAHDVVTASQGRNMLCLFCNPGKLSKRLSQVKKDISQGMMVAIFASHTAAVFVATKRQQSAVTVNVFPVRTHQPPPLSEHLPSRRPTAFVEDLQPSLPTHEAPSRSPDAFLSNDLLPSRHAHETPYAPVIAGVSNLDPHSHRGEATHRVLGAQAPTPIMKNTCCNQNSTTCAPPKLKVVHPPNRLEAKFAATHFIKG
ncbi:unnamed protein product [Urochloa humidicola]